MCPNEVENKDMLLPFILGEVMAVTAEGEIWLWRFQGGGMQCTLRASARSAAHSSAEAKPARRSTECPSATDVAALEQAAAVRASR